MLLKHILADPDDSIPVEQNQVAEIFLDALNALVHN
jgi:hypothetical protein